MKTQLSDFAFELMNLKMELTDPKPPVKEASLPETVPTESSAPVIADPEPVPVDPPVEEGMNILNVLAHFLVVQPQRGKMLLRTSSVDQLKANVVHSGPTSPPLSSRARPSQNPASPSRSAASNSRNPSGSESSRGREKRPVASDSDDSPRANLSPREDLSSRPTLTRQTIVKNAQSREPKDSSEEPMAPLKRPSVRQWAKTHVERGPDPTEVNHDDLSPRQPMSPIGAGRTEPPEPSPRHTDGAPGSPESAVVARTSTRPTPKLHGFRESPVASRTPRADISAPSPHGQGEWLSRNSARNEHEGGQEEQSASVQPPQRRKPEGTAKKPPHSRSDQETASHEEQQHSNPAQRRKAVDPLKKAPDNHGHVPRGWPPRDKPDADPLKADGVDTPPSPRKEAPSSLSNSHSSASAASPSPPRGAVPQNPPSATAPAGAATLCAVCKQPVQQPINLGGRNFCSRCADIIKARATAKGIVLKQEP